MIVEKWFSRYGIVQNPFKDEEAKDDGILQKIINSANTHPDFEKVYGEPASPSTSVVFGEKGSGKTALRMLITRRLVEFNREHPDSRAFVIEYDDWNALLDRFVQRTRGQRNPLRAFSRFRLWDHIDGIMSIGVTSLVDHLVDGTPLPGVASDGAEHERHVQAVQGFPHGVKRDAALLTSLFYAGHRVPFKIRFAQLLRKMRLRPSVRLPALRWLLLALLAATLAVNLVKRSFLEQFVGSATFAIWTSAALSALVGALYVVSILQIRLRASRATRDMSVVGRTTEELAWALRQFPKRDIDEQPFPCAESADTRYQLLAKFQDILRRMGFQSIVLLVDRVDEPHLVHGDPQLMKALVWPLLDNKFLKQPGMGVKLLLPLELGELIRKEDKQFFDKTRLDKQNLIFPLEWSGAALYDIANSRINACRAPDAPPMALRDFFEDDVREDDIVDALEQMRQPRDAFKFLYRLMKEHCRLYTEESSHDKISKILLRNIVKEERDRLEAFKAGWGHG